MPLYTFKCDCGAKCDELTSYEAALAGIICPACGGQAAKIIALPGKARINRANDLDYFGTPQYHEDRAKQCGVPT